MKKRKTKKERLIEKISAIIRANGKGISTEDLQLDTSPVFKKLSLNRIMLIERFNEDDVDVVTYFKDEFHDEECFEYSEVKTKTLETILYHLQEYAEQQEIEWEKTLKRISN